jgi:hypothetical protein
MEIIYPATKNVIAYDKAHLQFHNLVEYDEKGKVIETDLTGGATMQKIIQDANAHMQKHFHLFHHNVLNWVEYMILKINKQHSLMRLCNYKQNLILKRQI